MVQKVLRPTITGSASEISQFLSEERLKSRRSILYGVYARGSKRSHAGGKCLTCRGLHILEKDNSEINPAHYGQQIKRDRYRKKEASGARE